MTVQFKQDLKTKPSDLIGSNITQRRVFKICLHDLTQRDMELIKISVALKLISIIAELGMSNQSKNILLVFHRHAM